MEAYFSTLGPHTRILQGREWWVGKVLNLPSPRLALLGFHLVIATLSGVGGSVLRVFDSLEGTIIHEKKLHHPQNGQLYDKRTTGVHVAFGGLKTDGQEAKDIFVLTNGHTVHRIDGKSGDMVWAWTAPEQTYVCDFGLASLLADRALGPWLYSNALLSRIPRYMLSDSQSLMLRTLSTPPLSPQRPENS